MAVIMDEQRTGFGDLMKFPAVVDFRIIVDAAQSDSLQQLTAGFNQLAPGSCGGRTRGQPRLSRSGRYVSYTLPVRVHSAEKLEQIYREIGALPFVKHIL